MFTNAQEAADWLQGKRYASAKNGLLNMQLLAEALGHPEKELKCIHVAGTNGKGSVSSLTERALRACGKKTGLYTSPYLTQYNDRMRVNGVPMPDHTLIRLTNHLYDVTETLVKQEIYPTAFELGTALAFLYFREEKVDYAVIEVGIGGRLDPTNIISPVVSVIATIGLDHTAILGNTLPEVAFEKAGIIKAGVPCTATVQQECVMDVFRKTCSERNSPFFPAEPAENVRSDAYGSVFSIGGVPLEIRLPGDYQLTNAALSYSALKLLAAADKDITDEGIRKGFLSAQWPARLTWLDNVLIDGAHNPQGAEALTGYVDRWFKDTPKILVTAMMQDKEYAECAKIYSHSFTDIICTQIDYHRCATAEMMHEAFLSAGTDTRIIRSIPEAIAQARKEMHGRGIVVVAGSLYLAGDAIISLRPGLYDKGI